MTSVLSPISSSLQRFYPKKKKKKKRFEIRLKIESRLKSATKSAQTKISLFILTGEGRAYISNSWRTNDPIGRAINQTAICVSVPP